MAKKKTKREKPRKEKFDYEQTSLFDTMQMFDDTAEAKKERRDAIYKKKKKEQEAAAAAEKKRREEAAKPITYEVKEGTNLTKIAKQYGTTPDAIRKANNLKGDNIRAGQKLNIPKNKGHK